ncbi:MAG TPA: hypothetical protein PKX93_05440 [bacterium]|nr:hypothetical protein [bacterium]HOL66885.1 hypothetical protein [bacterium]HPP11536.1 hypothetical protein [bacterium]
MNLKELYWRRFAGRQENRQKIWARLCQDFFQRFIRESDRVLDVGAGYCEFINNIIPVSAVFPGLISS